MTSSKLIELTYYDPVHDVRLTAYADTIILNADGKDKIISAVRFDGYPEMVRAMSDAIYGGAAIEAVQGEKAMSIALTVSMIVGLDFSVGLFILLPSALT